MARHFVADTAAADIETLWRGHVQRGGTEAAADRLVDGFLVIFQTLADFPDVGLPRAYLPAGLLAFPYDRHMILYRKVTGGVDIVHVLYGSRDLASLFANGEE